MIALRALVATVCLSFTANVFAAMQQPGASAQAVKTPARQAGLLPQVGTNVVSCHFVYDDTKTKTYCCPANVNAAACQPLGPASQKFPQGQGLFPGYSPNCCAPSDLTDGNCNCMPSAVYHHQFGPDKGDPAPMQRKIQTR